MKSSNFYKGDIYKLKGELDKYARGNSIIVLPWLDKVKSPLDNILPGKKVSKGEFFNLTKGDMFSATNAIIVLVENSTDLSPIIDRFFKNTAINLIKKYDTWINFNDA